MQYRRKMGIDYGDKRIGIAFSDLLCVISTAYDIIKNDDKQKTLEVLANLAKEREVDEIIIGLPLNMQGEENERTQVTREFGEKLKNLTNLEVKYEDERLSSVEAEEILKEAGLGWEERKKLIDKFAAQVILQSYLDNNKK